MGGNAEPKVELIPRKPAVCDDQAVTLDVVVRITPPLPEVHFPRPPLNLALVLDRSGSMAGARKMPYAIEAAQFAVQQLLPADRVSVTVFDDQVDRLVPSTTAEDKAGIVRKIATVQPRGSTNLHGGWAEGGRQARAHLVPDGLNRVVLLSDGLANQGVTDPNAIAADVKGLAARGVSTTAMGLGDDYNEDLLEAMAQAGDGNYYYIESPVQLADLFTTELKGLMATAGQKVSLGVETGPGVAVADVLNDLDRLPTGRYKLPNLIVGMPVVAFLRLNVPARPAGADGLVVSIRVAWDPPRGGSRRSLHARLDLPSVSRAAWETMTESYVVHEQEALLMAARAQREAARALERGDITGSRGLIAAARGYMEACPEEVAGAEMAALDALDLKIASGDIPGSIKSAKFASWKRRQSRS